MIDISRIHVVDDTFPKWLENYIEKRADTIPWETRENKIDSDYTETTLSYLSYQNGYNNPPDKLELINLIHEVLSADTVPKNTSDIELTGFFGLRWNGVIKDHPPSTHRDWADASQYTIVYFVNHSDGDLIFYADDQTTEIFRCIYKRGRAVIFPSNIYHSATSPTINDLRITMAAQYYAEYNGHSIS